MNSLAHWKLSNQLERFSTLLDYNDHVFFCFRVCVGVFKEKTLFKLDPLAAEVSIDQFSHKVYGIISEMYIDHHFFGETADQYKPNRAVLKVLFNPSK